MEQKTKDETKILENAKMKYLKYITIYSDPKQEERLQEKNDIISFLDTDYRENLKPKWLNKIKEGLLKKKITLRHMS